MHIIDNEIAALLDEAAARYNSPDFIAADPVQFPRMFSDKRDIEIAALLASTIAWGNRTMICRSANKMFGLMDWQPYNYVMDEGYEDLGEGNIHRTFSTAICAIICAVCTMFTANTAVLRILPPLWVRPVQMLLHGTSPPQ